MDAVLVGLWVLSLLLPFARRRRPRREVVLVVLPVVLADQGAPQEPTSEIRRRTER